MKQHHTNSRRFRALALSLFLLCGATTFSQPAVSQEAAIVKLTLKNHRFDPAEPHAPANKPFTIEVSNLDGTPAEFESKTLRVEKVVAANGTISLQMRALAPGRYRFFDDYHEDTTEGFLVVQ
ncbi:MAG: cupredoxin domain-containing protein [Hyphomicrobiales bacterium]|nr:cupredoxin domain-containing protein [Hyphomicrobiales bacterium]